MNSRACSVRYGDFLQSKAAPLAWVPQRVRASCWPEEIDTCTSMFLLSLPPEVYTNITDRCGESSRTLHGDRSTEFSERTSSNITIQKCKRNDGCAYYLPPT